MLRLAFVLVRKTSASALTTIRSPQNRSQREFTVGAGSGARFSRPRRGQLEKGRLSDPLTSAEPTPASPRTAPAAGSARPSAPARFVVFLFEDMHLNSSDLALLQKAALKMVTDSLTDSDVAAVVSISGASRGLTPDREKYKKSWPNQRTEPAESSFTTATT